MNLAIHHLDGLQRHFLAEKTRDWEARAIVPWTTPTLIRSRLVGERLALAGLLRQLEVGGRDEGFFEIFRHRLRRVQGVSSLSASEEKLLFLAEHLDCPLWTGEPLVAELAREIGLQVCFGNAEPESWFPQRSAPAPEAAMVRAVLPELREIFLSHQFPSCRRVPGQDEPVQRQTPVRSVRSSGTNGRRQRAQP